MAKMTSAQFDAMFSTVKEVSPKERTAMKAILHTLVPMVFEHRKYGTLTEVHTTKYRDTEIDKEIVVKIINILSDRLDEVKKKLNGGGELMITEEDED